MKKKIHRLIMAAALPLLIQNTSADVLLTDNFQVINHSGENNNDLNVDLATRQTGTLAPTPYLPFGWHHQVGNTTTDVGQPGGAANGDYVLVAINGAFCSDVDVAAVTTGPITIEFDYYLHGANPGGGDDTTWVGFALRTPADMFPVAPANEFGFLVRANGGVQVFQDGQIDGQIPGGLDIPGTANDPHWTLIFSDATGTGNAFNGNGSQVTLINGTTTLGTLSLSQLKSAGLRAGFRVPGNRFGGVDNLKFSGTPAVLPPINHNLSFEYNRTMPGTSWNYVPTSWTGFSLPGTDRVGSQYPSGVDFTVATPLAAPADGNQFCWINAFDGNGKIGLYQDMGALQPNTIYTLTVAIGSRADRINSPGIIQLVNGTNNTGVALATGGGLPDTQDTWQDYTISYTNGPSASGEVVIVLAAQGAGTIQANFDNVRLTTAPAPAVIAPSLLTDIQPRHSRVTTGTPLSFSVTANGSLPLSYQWFDQSGAISGATSATYSFNAVAGTFDYYVRVTNSAGVVFSSTNEVVSSPDLVTVNNFSFEEGSTPHYGNGALPLAWTAFNDDWAGLGTGPGFPAQYGEMYLAVNTGPGHSGACGIYQEVGALLPNTIYTLTVAIGRSTAAGVPPNGVGDWSPGIISLINGGNNTGTLLASTTGYPDTVGTWQDYTVSFTNVAISGPLTIALAVPPANTYQASFDYVRLTTAPAPALIPPTILTDLPPLKLRVTTGAPLSWTVTASGSLPLSYQWFNQDGPVGGANSATYSFNAVAGTNNYFVRVTNSVGVVFSSTNEVVSSPDLVTINNFSFEEGSTPHYGNGALPSAWTAFNDDWAGLGTSGGGFDAPDGNTFFAVNTGPGHNGASGIYQDVGALLPNTTYALTVAIGRSTAAGVPPNGVGDWSPGIISLLNGTDSTGTVLASTTGYPDTVGTWQDYTATFTTGPATSGDLVITLSAAPANTWQATFDNVRLTKAAAIQFGPPTLSGGDLILTATGGTPGAGFTLLTATNLSEPISWTTNSTGTLDGAGAFSNAVPMGTAPARFYWLRVP